LITTTFSLFNQGNKRSFYLVELHGESNAVEGGYDSDGGPWQSTLRVWGQQHATNTWSPTQPPTHCRMLVHRLLSLHLRCTTLCCGLQCTLQCTV